MGHEGLLTPAASPLLTFTTIFEDLASALRLNIDTIAETA